MPYFWIMACLHPIKQGCVGLAGQTWTESIYCKCQTRAVQMSDTDTRYASVRHELFTLCKCKTRAVYYLRTDLNTVRQLTRDNARQKQRIPQDERHNAECVRVCDLRFPSRIRQPCSPANSIFHTLAHTL